MTTNNNQAAAAREIPVPPAGGSWTFDDSKWQWVSNDQAAVEVASPATAADTSKTNTAQEQNA